MNSRRFEILHEAEAAACNVTSQLRFPQSE